MCIGIPMIVKELPDEGVAICEGRGQREKIDIMMVGPLEPGTWILAWNGTAMDVLTEERAAQVNKALDSLENAMIQILKMHLPTSLPTPDAFLRIWLPN